MAFKMSAPARPSSRRMRGCVLLYLQSPKMSMARLLTIMFMWHWLLLTIMFMWHGLLLTQFRHLSRSVWSTRYDWACPAGESRNLDGSEVTRLAVWRKEYQRIILRVDINRKERRASLSAYLYCDSGLRMSYQMWRIEWTGTSVRGPGKSNPSASFLVARNSFSWITFSGKHCITSKQFICARRVVHVILSHGIHTCNWTQQWMIQILGSL